MTKTMTVREAAARAQKKNLNLNKKRLILATTIKILPSQRKVFAVPELKPQPILRKSLQPSQKLHQKRKEVFSLDVVVAELLFSRTRALMRKVRTRTRTLMTSLSQRMMLKKRHPIK
jgi:hypothetical protein